MNLNLIRISALTGCAALVLLSAPRVFAAVPGPQPPGLAQDRDDWERAPDEFNDIQRRGFHDGVEGARKDFGNHRRPNVDDRDEYRRPEGIPREAWEVYREAFRRGYDVGMSHLMGGPDWRLRAPDRPWDAPPNEFDNIRRQGFQDGVEGARKDYGNHRRPDVENRDEYRHPNLPPDQREAYRDGFRRGYRVAWDHIAGDRDRDRDDHDHY